MDEYEINLKLTGMEIYRLAAMLDHIGEEAHDSPGTERNWFVEKWWNSLSENIRDQAKDCGWKIESYY
jgi:hypothetical protein